MIDGAFDFSIVPTVAVLHWRTIEGGVQDDTILQSRDQSPWCSHMHVGLAGSLLAVYITKQTIDLFFDLLFDIQRNQVIQRRWHPMRMLIARDTCPEL